MTIKAEKLSVFIDSVIAFFEQLGERLEEIDTPYLNNNDNPIAYDYTGIINISGPIKGNVYVSASSSMLRKLLQVMQEPEMSLTLMKDLVGEIANTVSGNARSEFGEAFLISPPKVVDGIPSTKYLPKEMRTYVIPFHWYGDSGVIGICIT